MNASENVDVVIGCESASVTCCRLGCPNDAANEERASEIASVHGRCVLAASHASAIDERNGNVSESRCDGHGCANVSGICVRRKKKK